MLIHHIDCGMLLFNMMLSRHKSNRNLPPLLFCAMRRKADQSGHPLRRSPNRGPCCTSTTHECAAILCTDVSDSSITSAIYVARAVVAACCAASLTSARTTS
jgi:hypothetical protein